MLCTPLMSAQAVSLVVILSNQPLQNEFGFPTKHTHQKKAQRPLCKTHPDLQKLNFAVAQWCKTNIHQSKGQPLHTNNSMSSAHRKTTSITDTDARHRHRHTTQTQTHKNTRNSPHITPSERISNSNSNNNNGGNEKDTRHKHRHTTQTQDTDTQHRHRHRTQTQDTDTGHRHRHTRMHSTSHT